MDSSAFYAAADRGDRQNARAKQVLSAEKPLVTSDHVLIESWLLLRGRRDRSTADRFWSSLRAGMATIEVVGSADLEVAWQIGERFGDQDFSIVDRTSFAIMERLGIERVATFDDDFAVYRFGSGLRRAFEVVR